MTPTPLRYLWKLLTLGLFLLTRLLTRLYPRDKNRICLGAWFGDLYTDSPRYLAEYLTQNTSFHITWIGKPRLAKQFSQSGRIHFAPIGSFKAAVELLRARFWVCCQLRQTDLTALPIDGGVVCLNLWHGVPSKEAGLNSIWDPTCTKSRGLRAALERAYAKIVYHPTEYLTCSSPRMGEILVKGFPASFSRDKLVYSGTPRYDFLLQSQSNGPLLWRLREKYSRLLGFSPNEKIVLYVPTWRITGKNVFCFYNLPPDRQRQVRELLAQNSARLIEKHHFHTNEIHPVPATSSCSIPIDAETALGVDTQELLLIADIVICDYSSAYIDAAKLGKPVIHFVYDLNDYKTQDSGLAYDLEEIAGGPLVRTFDDLKWALADYLKSPRAEPKAGFSQLVEFEDGKSCPRIIDFIREV